jgi:hypothetical protein
MRSLLNQHHIDSIEKPVYINNKSSYETVAVNQTGYLRPMSESHHALNELQYGQGFVLLVENSVEIQEGWRITMLGDRYNCRGMTEHERGPTPYRRCLIVRTRA